MIGEQILNYRIDKLLGEGGMGAVYLATHTQLHKQVVIKEINTCLNENSFIPGRFRNEAALITGLQHPNIVSLFDYVETGGGLYLITEYVEGMNLSDYIQQENRPIPEDKAIRMFMEILDACMYAHHKNIVHLDLKPANILLTRDEQPKLLDFGIARLISESTGEVTGTGVKKDTTMHMSPEQVQGKQADERSDIYALGVIFFEMLTGRPPYNPGVIPEFGIEAKIANEALPRLKDFNPRISNYLQAIVDQATVVNPEERFQSCRAFKESIAAEKERQQELMLVRLMQEVAEKGHHQMVSENISTIKAAKIQTRNKRIQIGFIVFALLAAAFYIFRFSMIGFDKIDFSAFLPLATKKVNTADANASATTDYAELPGQQATNAAANGEEAIKHTASAVLSATARKESLTKQDFQQFLTAYYQTLQEKNVDKVQQFYAPPLTRFFSEYGVSAHRLNELCEQTWQEAPEYRHEILWNTFRYYQDDNNNYIMDFSMNYHFRPAGKSKWQQKKLYTMIKMNKDFKIFYITGD